MLGFGKKIDSAPAAPAEGTPRSTHDAASDAHSIAELLAAVGQASKLTVEPVSDSTVEVSGFGGENVSLFIAVQHNPLRLHATALWHGVIVVEDALELHLSINEWNSNFSWPRLQVFSDAQGHARIAADTQLSAAAGWTVKQLSDWIMHAAGGALGIANYAHTVWPDAPIEPMADVIPGDTSNPISTTALVDNISSGTVPELSAAIEPLATVGNPYHLVPASEGMMTVTTELLAEIFVGSGWQDSLISAGGGVKHTSLEWKGDKIDMTVHDGVLSVEAGLVLDGEGGPSQDLLAQMLEELVRANLSVDGAATSLVNVGVDEPRWLLRSLVHVPVKSGANLAQLERYCLGGAVVARQHVEDFRREFGL